MYQNNSLLRETSQCIWYNDPCAPPVRRNYPGVAGLPICPGVPPTFLYSINQAMEDIVYAQEPHWYHRVNFLLQILRHWNKCCCIKFSCTAFIPITAIYGPYVPLHSYGLGPRHHFSNPRHMNNTPFSYMTEVSICSEAQRAGPWSWICRKTPGQLSLA